MKYRFLYFLLGAEEVMLGSHMSLTLGISARRAPAKEGDPESGLFPTGPSFVLRLFLNLEVEVELVFCRFYEPDTEFPIKQSKENF